MIWDIIRWMAVVAWAASIVLAIRSDRVNQRRWVEMWAATVGITARPGETTAALRDRALARVEELRQELRG